MTTGQIILMVSGLLLSLIYLVFAVKHAKSISSPRLPCGAMYLTLAVLQIAAYLFSVFIFDGLYMQFLILPVSFVVIHAFLRMSPAFAALFSFIFSYIYEASRVALCALYGVITGKAASFPSISSGEGIALKSRLWIVVLTYAVCCVVFIIIDKTTDRKREEFLAHSKKSLWISVKTLFLLLVLLLAEMTPMSADVDIRLQSLCRFAVCVLSSAVMSSFFDNSRTEYRFLRKSRMDAEKNIESQYDFYDAQAKNIEKLKTFRHDYKNQLAGLKALIDAGEYARASEYLAALSVKFDGIGGTVSFSDNTLADSILQNLAKRCEQANIRFTASVIIGKDLPVNDLELCTLLCNVADNAFEATENLDSREKYIQFTTSRREKWIIITAENSFDGIIKTEKNQIVTKKKDSAFHGRGLKTINGIMTSVPGGSVRLEPDAEEGVFRISLIFPRNKQDSASPSAPLSGKSGVKELDT